MVVHQNMKNVAIIWLKIGHELKGVIAKTHRCRNAPMQKRTCKKCTTKKTHLQKTHPSKNAPIKNAPLQKRTYKNLSIEGLTIVQFLSVIHLIDSV